MGEVMKKLRTISYIEVLAPIFFLNQYVRTKFAFYVNIYQNDFRVLYWFSKHVVPTLPEHLSRRNVTRFPIVSLQIKEFFHCQVCGQSEYWPSLILWTRAPTPGRSSKTNSCRWGNIFFWLLSSNARSFSILYKLIYIK